MTDYRPPQQRRESDGSVADPKPVRLRFRGFVVRWVLLPGLFALGMFLWGMHLGAREPDAWYNQAARWLAE